MITITNNYFQDLNAAIEAGIIAKVGGKNPKKADLYEAIAFHNSKIVEAEKAVVPAKKYEWVEVEVDRFDLPEGKYRCDGAEGFFDWFSVAGRKYSRLEGSVHTGYVAFNLEKVEIKVESAPDDEVALQEQLLAMDAIEDAAKAAKVVAIKKTRKLPQAEQAIKNAQDLANYRAIVELKEQVGATKAAEQLTAQGRKMGGTTVCQIATTYHKVLMASPVMQQLFNDGVVTWGELYSRSRRINIASIEAEFNTRLAQAS